MSINHHLYISSVVFIYNILELIIQLFISKNSRQLRAKFKTRSRYADGSKISAALIETQLYSPLNSEH